MPAEASETGSVELSETVPEHAAAAKTIAKNTPVNQ
tara:strand:- start:9559 stop:9666 length:108 start_codon:yes stop_codon:yes gene_type:complete